MELQVTLRREHFPETLSLKTVQKAYWEEPCILEKAILEVIPDFKDKYNLGPVGIITEKRDKTEGEIFSPFIEVGEVRDFDSLECMRVAKIMEGNPLYTEDFTLFLPSIENEIYEGTGSD